MEESKKKLLESILKVYTSDVIILGHQEYAEAYDRDLNLIEKGTMWEVSIRPLREHQRHVVAVPSMEYTTAWATSYDQDGDEESPTSRIIVR